ncbi:MAG: CAP domain-containing protein [bacterium]|nr:CAP domain-containing protein [bacterium]
MAGGVYTNLRQVPEIGAQYFRHYFIPHPGNDHKPKALGANWLRFYSVLMIAVKIFVTGFLFAAYPTPGQFASYTAGQIIELTNGERRGNGLASLTTNQQLATAAANKANDMLAKGYFDHTGPDGSRPWSWISGAGYDYIFAGENLAKDFTSAASTVAALMNSASHRKNILNSNYDEIGVAVVDGVLNGNQTVVMVQFFGAQAEEAPTPPPPPAPAPAPQPVVESASQETPTPPVDEPATPPAQPATPPAAPTPPPPPPPLIFTAELKDQSTDTLQLASGVSTTIWAEFENTGTVNWENSGSNFVAINTTNPAGRESVFQSDEWLEPYRPMLMRSELVRPGEIEKFEFLLTAPEEPGTYEESFGLVAENLTWIEGGVFSLPVIVTAPDVRPAETVEPPPVKETPPPTPEPSELVPASPASAATLISPTQESYKSNQTVERNKGIEGSIVYYSQKFFLALLVFLVIALTINIFVNIRVQHFPTVFRTLLVIILASLLYMTRIHFVEEFGSYLNLF